MQPRSPISFAEGFVRGAWQYHRLCACQFRDELKRRLALLFEGERQEVVNDALDFGGALHLHGRRFLITERFATRLHPQPQFTPENIIFLEGW